MTLLNEELLAIKEAVTSAVTELTTVGRLSAGDVLVVGCSTSEVQGARIGTESTIEVGQTIVASLLEVLKPKQIVLAVQCCEHLNRALVVEAVVAKEHGWSICNALPQLHAGGATAMAAFEQFERAVVVETIQADAGLDMGDTFIGMHLRPVAVPVRLQVKQIGKAHVTAARTRPKYIGGVRAVYDESLM